MSQFDLKSSTSQLRQRLSGFEYTYLVTLYFVPSHPIRGMCQDNYKLRKV